VPRVGGDVEGGHFGVRHLDRFGVVIPVQFGSDGQTFLGGGSCDKLDNRRAADERLAAPVLGDVAEQAMLDLGPVIN